MKKWVPFLLMGLYGHAAGDERASFVVNVFPPDAQVYVVRRGAFINPTVREQVAPLLPPGHPPLPPGYLLGSATEELVVDFPQGQKQLDLFLLHPRCKPRSDVINTEPLLRNKKKIPQDQERYELPFRSPRDMALYWTARLLPWLALLGLGVLAPLVFIVRRAKNQSSAAAAEQQRANKITQQMVRGDFEDELLGKRLDDYRILERLGVGGMARVYRAVPESTLDDKASVAIKLLNQELAKDPDVVRRFDREKRIYESLLHPNIIKVMDSGVYQHQFYLVMELVRGDTLRSQVKPGGISGRQAFKLMLPVIEAVSFANKKGIAHRDLKPENVMLTDDGDVKVMDFGLARGSNFSQVTATGSVLGTPAYMAPEQIQGELDLAIDQYAIGVMLYELLCGEPPFVDENPVTLVIKHLSAAAPPLTSKKEGTEKISKVLERMLEKEPHNRFRDLDQALVQLRYVMI